MAESIYPIAILIDELKSDDVTLRLNAVARLSTIALALGPARTRAELVPFLLESTDDEDEVLVALAGELGGFVEFLGGAQFAHEVFPVLELLAGVEETLVRDKACESLSTLMPMLSPQILSSHALPLINRLSTANWFTSRASACAVIASVISVSADKAEIDAMLAMLAALVADETPMVRRAAAKYLGPAAKELDTEIIMSQVIPLYRKLASDDQDSVRLLTVDPLIVIAHKLSHAQLEGEAQLLNSVKSASGDKSWRVRYMVAMHFNELASVFRQEIVVADLTASYTALLKDTEAEVRTAAAGQLPSFAALIPSEIILASLIPVVNELSTDSSQHVRAALGLNLSGLAPKLGKEHTIESMLPLFIHLLKDEFPDVRLNIISKLDMVNDVIGVELLSNSLLPAIVELAEDKQWRVRQAIIEYIPLLAKQLGVKFFNEQLGNLCMSWLGDSVFSIREAATVNLRKLAEIFGVQWASTTIIPKIVEMSTSPNYLFRMTTIFAMTTMAPALDVETVRTQLLDTVLAMVSDPIPNVRFNVAKCLEVLGTVLSTTPEGQEIAQHQVVPAIRQLRDNADPDVKYFATKALESIIGGELRYMLNMMRLC